jgi:hypothetical protein
LARATAEALRASRIAEERRDGHLDGLTEREKPRPGADLPGPVERRHLRRTALEIKTVEPVVGSIGANLGLPADSVGNRRVRAALEYVRAASSAPAPY